MCAQSWLLYGSKGNFSNYMIFNFLHCFRTNFVILFPLFLSEDVDKLENELEKLHVDDDDDDDDEKFD